MKKMTAKPKAASKIFAFLIVSASLCAVYGDDNNKGEGTMSDQEYRDGMEQKKLAINDPEKAFKEDFWNACSSIALGDGFSVALQFRRAHPLVAEYHRRVMVFAGDARRGGLSGSLQLRMNFGGRTQILVYRHLDANGRVTHVTFEARDEGLAGGQSVRLVNPDFENPPQDSKREYVGLISGEAYPLKFVTPQIVSEESAREELK